MVQAKENREVDVVLSEAEQLRGRLSEAERELAEAAFLASLSDETPEGRSIVELARRRFGLAQL